MSYTGFEVLAGVKKSVLLFWVVGACGFVGGSTQQLTTTSTTSITRYMTLLHYVEYCSNGIMLLYSVSTWLNSINQLIFVMVKCGVLFEVRTEFLNVI
jgi:hypothetical protein